MFTTLLALCVMSLALPARGAQAALITFQSESGTLGTNFLTSNSGGVFYISNTNNSASTTVPSIPGRVASCSVTFPAAGTYDLYARARHDKNCHLHFQTGPRLARNPSKTKTETD
jgi:endo-1,4-beta-xylanase